MSAGDVIDRLLLNQYPTTCKCSASQPLCVPTYAQLLRVRRACIAAATTPLVYILNSVAVAVAGSGYTIGDYLEMVGGTPTGETIIVQVTGITGGGGVASVIVVDSSPYLRKPTNPVSSLPLQIDGSGTLFGSGAKFTLTFATTNTTCLSCGN